MVAYAQRTPVSRYERTVIVHNLYICQILSDGLSIIRFLFELHSCLATAGTLGNNFNVSLNLIHITNVLQL